MCDGGGRGGAAEDDVEQHPVDAQRVVVEGDGEALAELDELADLLEGPVTVRGYDVLNRLRGEEERTKSLNLWKRTGLIVSASEIPNKLWPNSCNLLLK